MDCTNFQDALLEADAEELRAEGGTPLAEHIRACPACRARAAAILDGTAALARALDAGVAARALPERRARRWRGALRIAIPLTAAATLAALLLTRESALHRDIEPPAYAAPRVPRSPVVNAAGDGAVAIMSTSNPSITIVWNF